MSCLGPCHSDRQDRSDRDVGLDNDRKRAWREPGCVSDRRLLLEPLFRDPTFAAAVDRKCHLGADYVGDRSEAAETCVAAADDCDDETFREKRTWDR